MRNKKLEPGDLIVIKAEYHSFSPDAVYGLVLENKNIPPSSIGILKHMFWVLIAGNIFEIPRLCATVVKHGK
jgi:hypothetical protein